jgi:CRISPR/Cas system endoribonuclease Cas6 (RAMP superfamily)
MAKHVIRYLLEGDNTVPKFVSDGGYFIDSATEELVGISVDEVRRHLPVTVHKLTRPLLKTWIINKGHNVTPEGVTMNEVELDNMIQAWLDARGLGDLV